VDPAEGIPVARAGGAALPGPCSAGRRFGPFDSGPVNQVLRTEGIVYGAGYGMYLKPTFFLARSLSTETIEGHIVHTTDHELVRDLFTAPAMLQGTTIYLRREVIRRCCGTGSAPQAGQRVALEDAFATFGIRPGQAADERAGPCPGTDGARLLPDAPPP